MDKENLVVATMVGYWISIASFLIGILGIFLTIYSFYKDKPDIFVLTSSGWAAAVLCASSTGWFGAKLVKLLAKQSGDIATLNFQLAEATIEKDRMINISEFIATKSIRSTTKKQPAEQVNIIKGNENGNHV